MNETSTSDALEARAQSADQARTRSRAFHNGWLLSTIPSFMVGVLTVTFSTRMPQWMHYPAELAAAVVRSIVGIATWSRQPDTAVLIMGWQWIFLPLYIGIWFTKLAPWGRLVQDGIQARLKIIDRSTRLKIVFGSVFMALYVLADVGLIPYFPTCFNGRWAYPPSHAATWLLPIYQSNFILMLYAWFSTIAEVSIWWALIAIIPNFPRLVRNPP